jgi:hypothetical protein
VVGEDGYPPTDLRFWRYLAAARTTPLRWALYYEREGYGDPSVEQIRPTSSTSATRTRRSPRT